MGVIELTGVSKTYGSVTAVNDLSLQIDQGQIYGLLGENGAGKTTTIKMLTGQTTPDTGTISVLEINPVSDPVAVREELGILPERESPPSFMTPREYFHLIGDIRGLGSGTVNEQIHEWGDRLAFTEQLDTLHMNLSRGQQQKVMIAQAFLHNPSVVVIDEPLVNLDPTMQDVMKRWLTTNTDTERTVLLSTHDISVAADICTHIGVMRNGALGTETPIGNDDTEETILELFEGQSTRLTQEDGTPTRQSMTGRATDLAGERE